MGTPKIRQLKANDLDKLLNYFDNLNAETRRRFSPHSFDLATIQQFYSPENKYIAYIITYSEIIIAYAIIKKGYVAKDKLRLENYGIQLFPESDFTFAPSVADAWQGRYLTT